MPKLTNRVPKYRRHKQSGQAIVTLGGRDFLLGPHRSKASRSKYNRLVAEWLANDRQPFATDQTGLTIGELVARYWRFCESYYVKNHLPTAEQDCIRSALRPLLKLYDEELASNFGPVALKAVRHEMLNNDWTRQTINKNIDRIRRMFRWAASEEILPVESYQRLATLPGLRKGRCQAREAEPVKLVDDATVEATLPFLPPVVADMVRVQRLTGMRPAEVCIMRPIDIDRSGETADARQLSDKRPHGGELSDVWIYRPGSHKTEHHDQHRTVFIGPLAQAILLPYLLREPESFCFCPAESERKRRAERHAARKTPLNHGNRPGKRRRKAQRPAGERYTVGTYRRAIERACDIRAMQAATGPIARSGKETISRWHKRLSKFSKEVLAQHYGRFRWTPNRLRHTRATEIRQQFGLEAAQVALGHSNAAVTEIYAERDLQKGIEVARKIG
jgi:integrase